MTKNLAYEINHSILRMATERGYGQSICPSEIARALFPLDWRRHMQEIKEQAIKLHKKGTVQIIQKGIPVDPDNIKGPVRIKLFYATK